MEHIFSLSSLPEVADDFWSNTGNTRVFAFHGDMGAGKTTFIHALCDVKGVMDAVGSPTFSIVNEYDYEDASGTNKIFHIDLYRLKDEEEAIGAGIEDCLYSGHVCFVEWPERAPGIFPKDTLHVYIDTVDSTLRKLRIGGK